MNSILLLLLLLFFLLLGFFFTIFLVENLVLLSFVFDSHCLRSSESETNRTNGKSYLPCTLCVCVCARTCVYGTARVYVSVCLCRLFPIPTSTPRLQSSGRCGIRGGEKKNWCNWCHVPGLVGFGVARNTTGLSWRQQKS